MDLRAEIIRLAHSHPEHRSDLLGLVGQPQVALPAKKRAALARGTVAAFLMVLDSKLTQYDRRQMRGQYYNPNALGLYLEAADKVRKAVARDLQSSDASALTKLKRAVGHYFIADFSPARAVIKQIDKFMAQGARPGLVASSMGKSAKFEKGKKVDVGKWLRDNGHAEVADKWEEHEGEIGKKASEVEASEEKEAKFEKGKKVDVAKWLKDNGHPEAATQWDKYDGTMGKKARSEVTEAEFDSLRSGQRLEIEYNSVMTSGGTREFQVGRASFSRKYNVHSKRLYPIVEGQPFKRGAKFILYKRAGGRISMGHGDMAVMLKSFRKL